MNVYVHVYFIVNIKTTEILLAHVVWVDTVTSLCYNKFHMHCFKREGGRGARQFIQNIIQ